MDGISLFPVFLAGLLGSVHCAGMCGGIVGALSLPARRPFPLPVRAVAAPAPARAPVAAGAAAWVVAYNAGRIASYAGAGALAGATAGGMAGGAALAGLPAAQAGMAWIANLVLVALGLYLLDAWRGLARLEAGGRALWRRLAPLLRRIGPPDTPARMFAAGAVWGWLPCGMVYSMLVTAMLTGSAPGGAAVMLAFGLGTLPMLGALGLAGARLRAGFQQRGVRTACGLLVLGFGLLGLWRSSAASGAMAAGWFDALCVAPGATR
ncbi:sulfite exporter TauE/SafE family protein [Massilia consociata]|uniref:Sulfite exporter TauE/SafE family protein n=1 Tax=Massilia consociata TaxID=760117 RepID=A0ABV6FA72_9BURK